MAATSSLARLRFPLVRHAPQLALLWWALLCTAEPATSAYITVSEKDLDGKMERFSHGDTAHFTKLLFDINRYQLIVGARVLESMLKGEPGGLALNRILAFLRKHTGWKTLGGTDVLDVCMMHSELLLFRVLHGEIVLFLKESSPSAGSPAVPIEQKSFSLFEPVLLPQLSSNDYFPVTVTHVATPHEIVLNMQTPETSQATSSLVSAMADFYSDHRARTALGRYVSIGCACAFFDASASESGGRRWRRGIVTDALGGDPVEVFDVDSGKKTPVPCEDLYVLLPKFHELPCQAINARLAMIHPLGGTGWDTAVSDRLVELSRDKVLMCSVVGSKGGILYVLLCDTNSLEDVWLNMMLVEEGLAMYYDDDCDVQR